MQWYSKRSNYIAYVRISWTREQKERNLSIPSQIDNITNYAKANNLYIEKIYREEQSAFKWKRQIFSKMIEDIKKSKWSIKGIVCFKWDRISRNISDFWIIDDLITKYNIEVISISEPQLNSYMGRYMIRDLQNRSVLYSEELSYRIKLWIRKKLQNWWDIWWNTPFWYKRIDWNYIPNWIKADIVKRAFSLYATWNYWYKTLASQLNKDFKWTNLFWWKVERILQTTTYFWIRTKIWNLNKEEYVFWWAESPWEFIEEYKLDFVMPLISRELFNKCELIRKQKDRKKWKYFLSKWFPKIFECSCWRNLARDDKKLIRYFKCTKHKNLKFPAKCNQWYTQLNIVEDELFRITKELIPNKKVLEKSIKDIEKEINQSYDDKQKKLQYNLKKIEDINIKNENLTKSFIEWKISQESIEKISESLNKELNLLTNENKLLQNSKEETSSYLKTIDFIKFLIYCLDISKINDLKEKSSKIFSLAFKMFSNLVFDNKKVLSYELNTPFNILKNSQNLNWWS